MPVERACPHCGKPLSPGRVDPSSRAPGLLGPGSNDEALSDGTLGGGRGSAAEPDPILGEFTDSRARAGSKDLFPSIDLSSPRRPRIASRSSQSIVDVEVPDRGRSSPLLLVVLGSYASALTLAMAWTSLGGNRLRRDAAPEPAEPAPKVEARPESGRQASLSRTVGKPIPIPPDHFMEPNKSLTLGSLEITPLDVRRQDVGLQKTNFAGQVDRRQGGRGALVLRLKLRNTSDDAVFAPIDQAFVRERGDGIVDTFVEAADGSRIYPFPLAVESEWSVAGQEFTELRPDEARVVSIATAPDAPGDDKGPFTWRIRLRTGLDRTDVVGIAWKDKPQVDRTTPKKY